VNNRPAVTAQLDQLQLSDTAKTHVYYITADAISNDTVYSAETQSCSCSLKLMPPYSKLRT